MRLQSESVLVPSSGRPQHLFVFTLIAATLLAACASERDPATEAERVGRSRAGLSGAPFWDNGAGTNVTFQPVAWPTEPAAALCGDTCGQWKPYTRFQHRLTDPRTRDPSNGGTAPQAHTNIASSCTDKALPSIYYHLSKHPTDPTKDVLFFRWRVERDAHTYATGTSPGGFSSTDPWSSGLWTVLFNLDGSGYRTLAAHINGSSGSPGSPIDTLAGIYGRVPTQSINYEDDPANIKLLALQPTAFVDRSAGSILNFQSSVTPTTSWPNGAAERVWDYGSTRAQLVTDRPCGEYFIDYQIPVAMLDATSVGGPKVDRSTPISMLFCTANSLNNPMQKDCALNRKWTADAARPGPFGDFISFDQDEPYAQPIIREVTAEAPSTCAQTYTLKAKVQDALYVDASGTVQPSVKTVSFWSYHDANGDGVSNDGKAWTYAATGSLSSGKLNEWTASWDSRSLPRGNYLLGVQAVDEDTLVDDGMAPSGVDNRTFSYVTSDALGRMYVAGAWYIAPSNFPGHSPAMAPGASEAWYGNPLVTGVQVADTGVDLALNVCGVSPTLQLGAAPSELNAGDSVALTVTVSNVGNPLPATVSSISAQLPAGFGYVAGSTGGGLTTSDPSASGSALLWTLASPVTLGPGASATLTFRATASSVAGAYSVSASASSDFGTLTADPVSLGVYSARLTVSQTPSRYLVAPDGTTQVTYTFAYANPGRVALSGVTLRDVLPANVNYVGCSGGSCAHGSGTVTWTLGTLAAGASGTASLTLTVAPAYTASSLANTVTLSGAPPTGSAVQASSTATIAVDQPYPLYRLTSSASAVQVAPGGSVTWTLTYANQGNGVGSNTTLVDTLPAGFTFSACSVGSSHFTTCSHANGVVTFGGAAGGVSVPVSGTGSVTLSAVADSAAIFSYPNPAVNSATISAGGLGRATSTSSVGVTGTYCEATAYFRRNDASNVLTALRYATTATPTSSAVYSTAVNQVTSANFGPTSAHTDQIVFNQQEAYPVAKDLAGKDLRIDFYLGAAQGGTRTRVVLERVLADGTTATVVTSADFQVNTSSTGTLYQYVVSVPTGSPATTTVNAGERLRWVFQFRSNSTKDIIFYYDSTTHLSRSSFCQASSPGSLTLAHSVDKAQIPGSPAETLTYTLHYTNPGGVAVAGTSLVETLPAGVTGCEYSTTGTSWATCSGAAGSPQAHTFALGSVAAGASGTVYVRGLSPASPTPGQTLTSSATLSGTSVASVTSTASTSVRSAGGGGAPQLALSSSADKSVIGASEVVTYTHRVVNVGGSTASNVVVSDALPATAYYSYVAGSLTGGTSSAVSGNTLTWNLGSLGVGASAAVSLQMRSAASGIPDGLTPLDNTPTVADTTYCTGSTPPAGCTGNTVTVSVEGKASLALTSAASLASVTPGTEVEYTLEVRNTGTSPASSVTVTDSLPAYAAFRSITAGTGTYDAAANRVRFSVGTLAAGASVTLKLKVVVDGLPGGTTTLTNSATASAGNAQASTSTVAITGTADPVTRLVASGPASLPGPAARLAAAAASTTQLTVSSASLLEVGGYVSLNGVPSQVTALSGTTVTLATPLSGSAGDALYRSATYALSYANSGNADAQAVVVDAPLPAGWAYIAAFPAPGSAPAPGAHGTVSWSLGSVPDGTEGSLQLVAIPGVTGTLSASLTDARHCTGSAVSGCTSPVTTVVGGLVARKSSSTRTVSLEAGGGSAGYTITLENSTAAPISGVSVTDALPSGFSYRAGSGSPAETSVEGGQPTWSGLTVPAGGALTLVFQADISPSTGSGTYDNALTVRAPAGVGVTPFDPLATTDEDVTVVGAGVSVVSGYVYRDEDAVGTRDGADVGLENVEVTVDDGAPAGPYSLRTDGFGHFTRVVPAGTWDVGIPDSTSNRSVLTGLALASSYRNPHPVTVAAGASSLSDFGYVPTASATYTVSTAVVGSGTLSPESATVAYGQTQDFTATPAADQQVKGITGCGGTRSGNLYTTGPVTADCTVTVTFGAAAVNSPPTASDDALSVSEDSGATVLDVLANDSSAPDTGETLSITSVTQPSSGGTVALEGGQLKFTPAANFAGTATFTYTVSDGNGGTATATVTVTVGAVNDAPTATDDALTLSEDAPTTAIDVLSNDSFAPDADETLTVTAVTQPAVGGTVRFTASGVTFTPAPDFNGIATFRYTLYDGTLTDTATVTVSVTPVNDAPDAVDDALTVAEDSGPTGVNVLANDTFAPDASETLAVTAVTQPATGGSVTLSMGAVGFTPAANFHGTTTFTYTLSDGTPGSTDTATVTVTVTADNDPPSAVDDAFTVAEDSANTVLDVRANDTSAPDTGETLTVIAVTQPASGTVTLSNGEVDFTPARDFHGTTGFTYTLSDGTSTRSANVTMTVTPVNDPPDAVDDALTLSEDAAATSIRVLANDSLAPDTGETLEVAAVTQPASGGTVTFTASDVSFTPAANFHGTTRFTYTASDGNGGSDTATVTVTVTAENDAPSAVDDAFTVAEDSRDNVLAVLDNDTSAPDTGETLSVSAVGAAAHGTVRLVDGKVQYTPAADYFGPDAFTYTLSDGSGLTDEATVTLTVTAVNDAPVATDDAYTLEANSGANALTVLDNDSTGVDGDETLSVASVTQGQHGTVAISGAGVTYTPAVNWAGVDSFTYTVADGHGGSATASVAILVVSPDSDGDGLTDVEEERLGSDPSDPDSDDDGLGDGVEAAGGRTGPLDADTDDDGLLDGTEDADRDGVVDANETDPTNRDTDADGLLDGVERGLAKPEGTGEDTDPAIFVADADPATTTDPLQADTDAGSVGDGMEDANHNGRIDGTETDPNVKADDVDSDGDGLSDDAELAGGSDPGDADSDDDGVLDDAEGRGDTDGDGVIDVLDPDSDNDGLRDGTEAGVTLASAHEDTDTRSDAFVPDQDPSTRTDPRRADTDADGLSDEEEDSNHDGRVDGAETDPNNPDTDGDGLKDGTEVRGRNATDPRNPDSDGDTLLDGAEDASGDGSWGDGETNPNDPDSDRGGVRDDKERSNGSNPLVGDDDLLVAGRGCSTAGGSALGAPLALLLLALLLRRRRAAPQRALVPAALAVAAVLGSGAAHAQAQLPSSSKRIDVQQYKPGPGVNDVLGLQSARAGGHLDGRMGLSLNLAHHPLAFRDAATGDFVGEVVERQLGIDLMGSVGLFGWLEVGALLPVSVMQSGDRSADAPGGVVRGTGLGDLRLVPKARLAQRGALQLGVSVPVVLPTSGDTDFLGQGRIGVQPRLLAELALGRVRLLANGGVNLRREQQLRNLRVGNELALGLGADLALTQKLSAQGSLVGAYGLEAHGEEERPLELLGALRYRVSRQLEVGMGAGGGLTRGYGTPLYRVMANASWSFDGPARPAAAPACAAGPEDLDGFQDGDGCADPDNDADGLLDAQDRCPAVAETRNGHQDEDGCADELPAPAPLDADEDGLEDAKDACPRAAEDRDGFQDEDGCPDLDEDKDGIEDAKDRCPKKAETLNGVEDADGCPDRSNSQVRIVGSRIQLMENVHFATNRDVILPRSLPMLQQAAALLKSAPHLELIRIEGHTDNRGEAERNLDLSRRRAQSVRRYLIEQGVAAERLEAEGYGEERPVATNGTPRGRQQNRRVDFTVVRARQ